MRSRKGLRSADEVLECKRRGGLQSVLTGVVQRSVRCSSEAEKQARSGEGVKGLA